jgi:recombination protein RecA
VEQLIKKHGEGSIQIGMGTFVSVDAIPTGIVNIDVATGCGGMPRGRIVEIFGNESSGKTTLCLQIIASCQSRGGIAAFIDAEHALDPDWAKAIGVDLSKLIISQPDSGEEALNTIEILARSGAVDLIIVDSVAALVPQAELDGEVGDHHIGAQARMLSQAMRKLSGVASKSKSVIIFINQLREKIGVKFGNPEMTPGGRALKFYASVRMQVTRKDTLVVDKVKMYGANAGVKIIKNKVAPPFQRASFEIHFGQPFQKPKPRKGIFKEAALVDGAKAVGIITTRGSNYYFQNERLANGVDAVIELLDADTDLYKEIEAAVYDLLANRASPKDNAESTVEYDVLDVGQTKHEEEHIDADSDIQHE